MSHPVRTVADLAAVPPLEGPHPIRWLTDRVQILRAALIQAAAEHPDWDADAVARWLVTERMDPRVVAVSLTFLGKSLPQEWAAAQAFAQTHSDGLHHLLGSAAAPEAERD